MVNLKLFSCGFSCTHSFFLNLLAVNFNFFFPVSELELNEIELALALVVKAHSQVLQILFILFAQLLNQLLGVNLRCLLLAFFASTLEFSHFFFAKNLLDSTELADLLFVALDILRDLLILRLNVAQFLLALMHKSFLVSVELFSLLLILLLIKACNQSFRQELREDFTSLLDLLLLQGVKNIGFTLDGSRVNFFD